MSSDPFGYLESEKNYIVARLIIAAKYLDEGNTELAKTCLNEVIEDMLKDN